MTTRMKNHAAVALRLLIGTVFLGTAILGVRFLVRAQAVGPSGPKPILSASDKVARGSFFDSRLLWIGNTAPSEDESALLLEALQQWEKSGGTDDTNTITFLTIATNSGWAPSLNAALGEYYFHIGLLTPALEHWELAWQATKDFKSGNGKRVADYTLAHWATLLASLGRIEMLDALADETRGRVLDRGRLSQQWRRMGEALTAMHRHPEVSYKCGSLALEQVAKALQLKFDIQTLAYTPSPESGFSMKELAALSDKLGLGLVPVFRNTGEDLPVPSVVHWRQNHYAAIVSREGQFYKVVDPTFGYPRFMPAEVINAEASGYFLAPTWQLSANQRVLGPDESALVVGRGNPNYFWDWDDYCGSGSGAGSGGGNGGGGAGGGGGGGAGPVVGANRPPVPPACTSCGGGGTAGGGGSGRTGGSGAGCQACSAGMPIWEVSEPYINLWLYDEPLSYQPAHGSRISLKLTYKQRNSLSISGIQQSSIGSIWNCSWISTISTYSGLLYRGGGGASSYPFATGQNTTSNYFDDTKLTYYTNASGTITNYALLYPDGSKDVYGFMVTNAYGAAMSFHLSQKISPEGYVTTFLYDDYDPNDINIRLHYVVDADGNASTLSYTTVGSLDNVVSQVSDPFGHTVYFLYDDSGLLTNITDVAGLSSSFAYNEYGWLTNLVTPYGTTSFAPADNSYINGPEDIDRCVTVTQADGGKQVYAYLEYPSYEPGSYSSSQVPTNTPLGTLDNAPNYRNSYHWGALQSSLLSTNDLNSFTAADYQLARMRHWLGGAYHGEHLNTLSLEREPSPDGSAEGQKTWYDYVNKDSGLPYGKGDHVEPDVVAQVLPDGSTWFRWFQLDDWRRPTNIVETYTTPTGTIGLRTNNYVYAGNGIDLLIWTNALGVQALSNAFNSYHQVTSSYDALNQLTSYTYDPTTLLLTSISRASGLVTTNIYDSTTHRLLTNIDLQIGRTNSYTWDSSGDMQTHTDERGLTISYFWDGLHRLTGTSYPDGTTTTNLYTVGAAYPDSSGGLNILDLTATKDRMGFWNHYGYDSMRRLIAETNANNVVTRYDYCSCGALLSQTNAWNTPVQQAISFDYDHQGNRLRTYYPDVTVTNWFDSLRRVITMGGSDGYRWFGYNNQGLLTGATNDFGVEHSRVFDILDRAQYMTDAYGVTVTNTYDDLGRLRTRGYPDGGVEKFGYSARGLIAYTNQLSLTNFYAYDEAGRKTFETNANAEVIRYTNNAAGDLLSITDGKNQTTRWQYDTYGRVTNKIDQANSSILHYSYDPGNRLTNRWSTTMGSTTYRYDQVGNLTNVDYPVGTADVTFGYDALNRVTNMVDGVGTTKYTYTPGGQLWTEDGPWANDTITNTYVNRLRTELDLQQPTGLWTNAFGYDTAGRLTNVTSKAGVFGYTLGGTSSESPLIKELLLPNTSYITNSYDSNARLLSTLLNNSSGTPLDSALYGYNAANQRTEFTNAAGTYARYGYDNIGQLKVTRTTNSSGTIISGETKGYVYDKAWNLSTRTNSGSGGTTAFTVDSRNRLNGGPDGGYSYDNNGNLLQTGTSTYSYTYYTYDAENRLVTVNNDRFGGYSPNRLTDFAYDGLGRLRVRTEYTYNSGVGDWVWASEVHYIYDGMRVIQERDVSNVPTVSYTRGTDLSGTLEGAGGIGGLLARSDGYSSGNWTSHNFYHADGNGNITYLVNSSQTLAASYRYDAYGNQISKSGSLADANVYRFSSKERMVINDGGGQGLYYYGYRFYSPNLQRWVNRDPLGEPGFEVLHQGTEDIESDGPNLYVFVGNNPINRNDPFGLSTQDKIDEIKKAIEKAQQIRDILAAARSGKGCACADTATATMCQCALNAFTKGDAQEMAECFCIPFPDINSDCMRRALKITRAIIKAKEIGEKAEKAAEKTKESLEKMKSKLQVGAV